MIRESGMSKGHNLLHSLSSLEPQAPARQNHTVPYPQSRGAHSHLCCSQCLRCFQPRGFDKTYHCCNAHYRAGISLNKWKTLYPTSCDSSQNAGALKLLQESEKLHLRAKSTHKAHLVPSLKQV